METALRNQMQSQVYALMSDAELEGDTLSMPELSTDPAFAQSTSGQYAWIQSASQLLWRSESSQLLPASSFTSSAQLRQGEVHFLPPTTSIPFYRLQHDVTWQQEKSQLRLRFTVAHTQQALQSELDSFQQRMLLWLLGLSLLLTASQLMITRWGLRPLQQMAADLSALESGRIAKLSGNYPTELRPVTDSLNQVLNAQQKQRERYKNTLGDLAHSLKTPLALIKSSSLTAPEVSEQVDRMDTIISHQLNRAHLGYQPLSGQLALPPLIERVTTALIKLPDFSHINISLDLPESLQLQAESSDMLEIIGNLMENACKYGRQQVCVSARVNPQGISILIEDDGPGIDKPLQTAILQRGARADTATLGQGIGLAVVCDILSSYGGELKISDSRLGGAALMVHLPTTPSVSS